MKLKPQTLIMLLSFFVLAILFITLLGKGMWAGFDDTAHYQRMISLNNELAHRQIPPLFDYWTPGSLGYSWQLFYPPLSSALFLLAKFITLNSADIFIQMKVVFFLLFIIAFASAYYAAKLEYSSSTAGALCAITFISSGYFLTNIYIRFALGESLAMSLMPLFIRGCSSLISDRKNIWLLPLTTVGIFLSNIPSLAVIALFFVIFAAVNFRLIAIKDNILFFAISFLLIISISAFYWFPLLYHLRFSDIFAFSGMLNKYELLYQNTTSLTETLLSLPSTYGKSAPHKLLSVGIIQLILAVAYLKYGVSATGKKMVIIALLFIVATSNLTPWDKIPNSVPVLNLIQFPWRLLSCATAIIALHISGMLARMLTEKKTLVLILTCFCIAAMSPAVIKVFFIKRPPFTIGNLYPDYLNNSNLNPKYKAHIISREAGFSVNPSAPITSTAFVNGYPEMIIHSSGLQTVMLPYIMYAGYYLNVDGQQTDITRLDSGLVGVTLNSGEHTVKLGYNSNIVIIPTLMSLFSCLFAALFFYQFAYVYPRATRHADNSRR